MFEKVGGGSAVVQNQGAGILMLKTQQGRTSKGNLASKFQLMNRLVLGAHKAVFFC